MKIVYLANVRLPTEKAHGLQIMKMCEAFALAGHQLELVVPARFNKVKGDSFAYYGVKRIFKITRLFCLDATPLDWLLGNTAFWIRTLTFLVSARVYLWYKNLDLLYTREQFANLFFKQAVYEIHALPPTIKWFHRAVWRRARLLVVLTGFIKQLMVEQGAAADKIIVCPDAVDLAEFPEALNQDDCRDKCSLPLDKTLIGYVGMLKTLGMDKGIITAIKALRDLPPNVNLVLVGGAPADIADYQKISQESGLGNRVIFTGKVPHRQVPFYLKAMDVLIAPFPSNQHYNYYMSPLKIFEYLAAAKPIIATDLPSLKEVLNHHNALLIEPNNAQALSAAIAKALADNKLAESLAQQASRDAKQHTWQKRVIMILDMLVR